MAERNKYKMLFFTRYFAEFTFYSFLSLYLKNEGYSGTKIGTVLSFSPLLFVLALPLWNKFDNGGFRNKLIVVAAAMTVAFQFLFLIPMPFILVSVITILYSISRAPFSPSIDSMSYIYSLENNYEYSKLRSFGSIGFIVAVIIGSFLFDSVGFKWMIMLSAVIFAGFSLTSLSLKPLTLDNTKDEKKGDYKQLFKNSLFVKFLIAQVLCFAMMNINNTYELLYMNSRNIKTYYYGLYSFVRVLFEIVMLILLTKSTKSYKLWFMVVPILLIGQSGIYFFNAPFIMLFLGAIVAGSASGIIIFLNNKYIVKIVRPKNITIATYITVIVQNLSLALFVFIAGIVYDKLSINHIYLFSGISLVGSTLFILFFFKNVYPSTIIERKD